ncbi:hypothetical protein [Bradyrhizobium sp. HKCCYLRH3061]|uniref:hypothetical protein n=1 Tax=Bradyrhizobium sp. HKCCYLRH3061 TaxID=3420734 RepID=UPI003EB95343
MTHRRYGRAIHPDSKRPPLLIEGRPLNATWPTYTGRADGGQKENLSHEATVNLSEPCTARKPPPRSVKAIRHRLIAAKYRAAARDKQDRPKRLMGNLRMREFERLLKHRDGRHLPADEHGRNYVMIAFHHIAVAGVDVVERCRGWAAVWAPWMPPEEAEALAHMAAGDPQRYKAARLGELLGLTDVERTALKIRTIWACDVAETPAERRKRKDRERKREDRAGKPKRVPLSQTEPWKAAGISRATYYRRKAKTGETNRVHTNLVAPTVDANCLKPRGGSVKRPFEGRFRLADVPKAKIPGMRGARTGKCCTKLAKEIIPAAIADEEMARRRIGAAVGRRW